MSREYLEAARENWRILLLIVLVIASTVALFAPTGGADDPNNPDGGQADRADSPTNLRYGLQLSGGTRVRAPLVGITAGGLDLPADSGDQDRIEREVAAELNVSVTDVRSRPTAGQGNDQVELYSDNISHEAFASALTAVGLDASADQVSDGVTDRTRETAVGVIEAKINQGGLTGGRAAISRSATGDAFVLVEVPNANRSQVVELIGSRGTVEVVALYPNENGTGFERETVLTQEHLRVSAAVEEGQQGPAVPVQVTDEDAAGRFADTMRDEGFTSNRGIGNCDYQVGEGPQDDSEYCLLTVTDGEVVYAASMGDLAQTINNGEFVANPTFQIGATNVSEANRLELNLRAGALPTNLAIDQGTTYFLLPSLAEEFKLLSLLTGFLAVLAVAGVVFLRYREPGVAIPMLITAAAEVYLLLGFAATVGLALDLSHIAGLIAVVGTGVDDLIIIADEILQGGEINTGRVFQSRFRKAFWVIGAAAATTIIAMSPLAVLSLGDLRGFAIVTIVGVLLGVLVTRPAYGNILRNVVLD
jgi:preprotein translocase subunit SecD